MDKTGVVGPALDLGTVVSTETCLDGVEPTTVSGTVLARLANVKEVATEAFALDLERWDWFLLGWACPSDKTLGSVPENRSRLSTVVLLVGWVVVAALIEIVWTVAVTITIGTIGRSIAWGIVTIVASIVIVAEVIVTLGVWRVMARGPSRRSMLGKDRWSCWQ